MPQIARRAPLTIAGRTTRALACAAFAALLPAAASLAAERVTLSGVRGVKLIDAGRFSVSGSPTAARDETFEFLQRPDGGYTLLSATTMRDGQYRVQARYDYDAKWNAVAAAGEGIYGDEPVRVEMSTVAGGVAIRVRGEKTSIDRTIPCPKGCFMDMAPSGSPMFVMMRHYDRARRGEQSFQWAAQDLPKPQTSPDNQQASIDLRREIAVARPDGSRLMVREYRQIERIPTPAGLFVMEFDLWTDDADRPIAYRINTVQGKPPAVPIVAIRDGYEDVRAQVVDGPR
jgi:hypothetical protein